MKSSKKKILWLVIAILLLVMTIVFGVLTIKNMIGDPEGIEEIKKLSDKAHNGGSVTTSENGAPSESDDPSSTDEPEEILANGMTPSEVKAKYSIDFAELYAVNGDIHAWITIPGTPIDYPVLQSDESALYYERRSYTGEYSISGCIFTQYYNRKNFTDRNTLVYGHYMTDGTFFGSLHNYRNPEFFEANRYMYVTVPGHILVYDIFAAYEYDNRHILAAFDFANDEVYAQYLESCLNPVSMSRNVREGVELDIDDRIITLSTCTSYTDTSRRYLVQGVLVADVKT